MQVTSPQEMGQDRPTLDYYATQPLGQPDEAVRAAIIEHVASTSAAWVAMSVLGLGIVVGVSAFFAQIIGWLSPDPYRYPIPWWPFFLLGLAIQGMLVVREWRLARTEWEIVESAVERVTNPGRPSSRGEWELHTNMVAAAMWVDVLTWGPRQVAMGLRRITGRAVVPGAGRIDHASHITRLLMESGNASTLNDLLARSGHHPATTGVIAWMKRCDLVDGSSDGKRVWLSSDFVRDIERRRSPTR